MIRFHVLNHEIVQLPSVQGRLHIIKKQPFHGFVYRVKKNIFIIQQ